MFSPPNTSRLDFFDAPVDRMNAYSIAGGGGNGYSIAGGGSGGGGKVPVGSTSLMCHADYKGDRAFEDGYLECNDSMTVQVRATFSMVVLSPFSGPSSLAVGHHLPVHVGKRVVIFFKYGANTGWVKIMSHTAVR